MVRTIPEALRKFGFLHLLFEYLSHHFLVGITVCIHDKWLLKKTTIFMIQIISIQSLKSGLFLWKIIQIISWILHIKFCRPSKLIFYLPKHMHWRQLFVLTVKSLVPQQSPSSKLHWWLLASSSQNPSPAING